MFSVTGHGTFADGPVASTWLFTMQGDTLANAGVLAHDDQVDPFVLVGGRGTPFSVHGAIPRGCTTSGLRDLRAVSASDRPVYYASDAGMLLALRYRTAPARACKGMLMQGQRTVTSMLLDELDPEHGTWSTRTTQAVPVPAGTCRTTYPLAVDLRRDRAAVALVTCTIVDAQDSVSIQSCQLTLHAWQGGVWTFASAPRVLDSVPLDVRVSSNPARMTVYGDESSQLFRSEDGMLRSEWRGARRRAEPRWRPHGGGRNRRQPQELVGDPVALARLLESGRPLDRRSHVDRRRGGARALGRVA